MWSGREDQHLICSDKCTFHYSASRQEEREREIDRHLVFLNGEHRGCCDSTLRNNHRLGSRIDGLTWSWNISSGQKNQKSGHIDQYSMKWC